MRRTMAMLGGLIATMVFAGSATAAVVDHVAVTIPTSVVHPLEFTGGVYQWTVGAVPAGSPWEITAGTKSGHCIDFVAPPGAGTDETLRSGADVDLRNSDPAGITTAGASDPRVSQVKWLLLSSRSRSTTGDLAAGHQLAIWRITNPTNGPQTSIEASIYDDPANGSAPSLAARLLAEAQASGSSANNAPALIGGGGTGTCTGTTRAITVTGTPFTSASVSVTGPGSIAGQTSLVVNLGPTGSAVLNVLGTTGAVTVTATAKESAMVQVHHHAAVGTQQKQDVATIELRDVTVSTTVTFVDCTIPAVKPAVTPAAPKIKKVEVTRLAVDKSSDRAEVPSGGIVHYTITVRNAGNEVATNVKTCDRLPDGMTYVSTGGGRLERGRACFTKASLAVGASIIYRLVARVDNGAAGTFVNRVTTVADNAPQQTATATVHAKVARKPRKRQRGVVG